MLGATCVCSLRHVCSLQSSSSRHTTAVPHALLRLASDANHLTQPAKPPITQSAGLPAAPPAVMRLVGLWPLLPPRSCRLGRVLSPLLLLLTPPAGLPASPPQDLLTAAEVRAEDPAAPTELAWPGPCPNLLLTGCCCCCWSDCNAAPASVSPNSCLCTASSRAARPLLTSCTPRLSSVACAHSSQAQSTTLIPNYLR
jgi:hypothetical protein